MLLFSLLKRVKSKELKCILAISLANSIFVPYFFGIGIWFKEPFLICTNVETNQSFKCFEGIACNNPKIKYSIDKITSSKSLSTIFNLTCERKSLQRFAFSLMMIGSFLGCIFNSIIYITKNQRKNFVFINQIILTIANLASCWFYDYYYIICALIGVGNFCWISSFGNSSVLMSENLPTDLKLLGTQFLIFTMSLYLFIYSLVALYVNGNMQTLFIFSTILNVIILILFFNTNIDCLENSNESGKVLFIDFFH